MQCRGNYLSSDAEALGMLGHCVAKTSGIRNENKAEGRVGLFGKGKGRGTFQLPCCVHTRNWSGIASLHSLAVSLVSTLRTQSIRDSVHVQVEGISTIPMST